MGGGPEEDSSTQAAAAGPTPLTLTLSHCVESATHTAHVLATIRGATLAADEERAPVHIAVAQDVSGSMTGAKLSLAQKTLCFLINELGPRDRLSLVSFNNRVTEHFLGLAMDEAGRSRANACVHSLRAGGGTNLSGGLFGALEGVLEASEGAAKAAASSALEASDPSGSTAIRAVLLFTDGHANAGITETASVLASLTAQLPASSDASTSSIKVHTMGFGDDHDPAMLSSIADVGGGTFYHISTVELISLALAQCVGDLLYVVAQNTKLTISTAARSSRSIRCVHGPQGASASPKVTLGDIGADQASDVLVEIELADATAEFNVTFAVRCVDALNPDGGVVTLRATLRGGGEAAAGAESGDQRRLTAQRMRVDVAAALQEAHAQAAQSTPAAFAEAKATLAAAAARVAAARLRVECDAGAVDAIALLTKLATDVASCSAMVSAPSRHDHLDMLRTTSLSHSAQRSPSLYRSDLGALSAQVASPYMSASQSRLRQRSMEYGGCRGASAALPAPPLRAAAAPPLRQLSLGTPVRQRKRFDDRLSPVAKVWTAAGAIPLPPLSPRTSSAGDGRGAAEAQAADSERRCQGSDVRSCNAAHRQYHVAIGERVVYIGNYYREKQGQHGTVVGYIGDCHGGIFVKFEGDTTPMDLEIEWSAEYLIPADRYTGTEQPPVVVTEYVP
tara:strand:- start:21 stop:2057 length:2037 start_codon:yes stop_codon:yes gene_type:complete